MAAHAQFPNLPTAKRQPRSTKCYLTYNVTTINKNISKSSSTGFLHSNCIIRVKVQFSMISLRLTRSLGHCCYNPKVRLTVVKNAPRNFSFYSAIQSLAETQASFFKTLSESAPVGHFQNMLLTVHDYTGLPWWATIIGTTVVLRSAITLPLAIHQHYILAKVENLNMEMVEISEELKKEMAVAIPLYKWDEKTAKMHYRRSVIKIIVCKKFRYSKACLFS